VINPIVVEGQVRAGVAQGIGLALLEHATDYGAATFLAGSRSGMCIPSRASSS
jgi:aerobic carbon-monoxide dehydrogenase large subunit